MRNQAKNLRAGGAITVSSFVKVSTAADNTGLLQTSTGGMCHGISQVGPHDAPGLAGSSASAAVAAGDPLQLFDLGDICLLVAGTGGWTAGQEIMSDTSGHGIALTTGSNYYVGAIGLEATAAGAAGRVQVVNYRSY